MTDRPATNDEKPELKPANENPWYCLMTLHGEQTVKLNSIGDLGDPIHLRNRTDWNRWMAAALSEKDRAMLRATKTQDGRLMYTPEELTPHSSEELHNIFDRIKKRSGIKSFPNQLEVIKLDITNIEFDINANGYIFISNIIVTNLENNLKKCLNSLDFRNCTFFKMSFFNNSEFNSVFFSDSIFKGGFLSNNSKMNGQFLFDNTINLSHSHFSNVEFSLSNDTTFKGAVFCKDVSFFRAKLEGPTNFSHAKFLTIPPTFHGAQINDGIKLDHTIWPKVPDDRSKAQDHVYNYQRLKQIVENFKKHEDELIFFAREMRAQRVLDGGWMTPRGVLNSLYGLTCDYGLSVSRPAWSLLVTFLLTTLPIAFWMSWSKSNWYFLPKFKNALGLSLANFLALLNVRKDFFDPDDLIGLPVWLKLLGGFQTIAGLFFAFLIALSLRNRFRLK